MRALLTHRNYRADITKLFALHRYSLGGMGGRPYSSTWPEGPKAFQRKLVATLDPERRGGRRLSKLEVEEVAKELDFRISSNKLSASGIADILRAFAESQVKLIKSRKGANDNEDKSGSGKESYIKPLRNKSGGDRSFDPYNSQLHPTLLNLVSSFVRIMSSQRDKGAFNGVLFRYVANGIYRMNLRWHDLGDAQKPFLEAFARTCPSIRKQDLDFILGTLGGSGLNWYAIPHEVRGSIVRALDRVLREVLEEHIKSGVISGTGKENKHDSIHNTLYGMAQLQLSLTPQKLNEELCSLVWQCIESECENMTYWRLARTVWHLARLSERGLVALPPSTLNRICLRLDAHVQKQRNVEYRSASSTEFGQANRQNDMNILWGLGVMGVTWHQLDQRTQGNLLYLGERNLDTATPPARRQEIGSKRNRRAEIAVYMGRLRVDVTAIDPSGKWVTHLHGGLLDIDAATHDPASLPLLLLGIAKIVGNSRSLSLSQKDEVQRFTRASLGVLETYLIENSNRKDLLNKREICNLLWSLGSLGFRWSNDSVSAEYQYDDHNMMTPVLRRLLIKQIAILFRKSNELASSMAFNSDSESGLSRKGASLSDIYSNSNNSKSEDEIDLLGYHGTPGGSILPHLFTSTLSFSSLKSLGSFREMLYPTATAFGQTDIYNWFGAIAALRIPFAALPEACSNSLLVALAGDLSLQGPSTVAHVLQLLQRCDLTLGLSAKVPTSIREPQECGGHLDISSSPGFVAENMATGRMRQSHSRGRANQVELPVWIVPELVRKLCGSASAMGPVQLTSVVDSLAHGLCRDMNVLDAYDGKDLAITKASEVDRVQVEHDTMCTDILELDEEGVNARKDAPLAALISRRLSQAIAASLSKSMSNTKTPHHSRKEETELAPIPGLLPSSGSNDWDVPMVLRLIEHLQYLRWARDSSWSAQSVLNMHTQILLFLLNCSDIQLQIALQEATPKQLTALKRYLGEETIPIPSLAQVDEDDAFEGTSLRQIPSLAADTVRFAERWRAMLGSSRVK